MNAVSEGKGDTEMAITKLGIAAAAVVMVAGFSAAPANAEGVYVAIAGSPSTDAWGWAYADTMWEATDLAVHYCSQDGATDCVWQARGNGCIAMARSDDGIAGGAGEDTYAAEEFALRQLYGGRLVSTQCAGPPQRNPRAAIDEATYASS
jgi:Domain of unknown function (DUF4189)